MKRLLLATAAFAVLTTASYASDKATLTDNSACWDKTDVRIDVSCTLLTEKLLLSLRLASRGTIIKKMKAEGRPIDHGGLHFMGAGNHGTGDLSGEGDLNIIFEGDRAVIIFADVDSPDAPRGHIDYVWNDKLGGCSDFPGSKEMCSTMSPIRSLMLEGLTDDELNEVINAAGAAAYGR